MERARLAEQKFRPLKKMMQQTFTGIKRAVQASALPEKRAVDEFTEQVRIMISYPGFHDAAYPEFLAASEELNAACADGDKARAKAAVQAIVILQNRCHQGRGQGASMP